IFKSAYKNGTSSFDNEGINFSGETPLDIQNQSEYHSSAYPGQIIAGSGYYSQQWYNPKSESEKYPGQLSLFVDLYALGMYNNESYSISAKYDSILILEQTTPHIIQHSPGVQIVHP